MEAILGSRREAEHLCDEVALRLSKVRESQLAISKRRPPFLAPMRRMRSPAPVVSGRRVVQGENTAGRDAADSSRLEITLAGEQLTVTGVQLYPEPMVDEWRQLLADARAQLGGVSTGLGFIGSPEWVIGASIALGALEGLASAANAQEGRNSLRRAQRVHTDLRRAGRVFRPSALADLDLPVPAAWSARSDGTAYVSLGEDFLMVETLEKGCLQVRWSQVGSYKAMVNGKLVEPPPLPEANTDDPGAYFLG